MKFEKPTGERLVFFNKALNKSDALKDLNIPQDIMGKASITVNTKPKVYKTKQSNMPDLSVPMKPTRIKWEKY